MDMKKCFMVLLAFLLIMGKMSAQKWNLLSDSLMNVSYNKADITKDENDSVFIHMPAGEEATATFYLNLQGDDENVPDSCYYRIDRDEIEGEIDSVAIEVHGDSMLVCIALPNTSGIHSFSFGLSAESLRLANGKLHIWAVPNIKPATGVVADTSLYENSAIRLGVYSQEEGVKYEWYQNDQLLEAINDSVYEGVVLINDGDEWKQKVTEDTYRVRCMFGHGDSVWATVDSIFHVKIYPLPFYESNVEINESPSNVVNLLPGDAVSISAKPSQSAGVVSYQWKGSGRVENRYYFVAENDTDEPLNVADTLLVSDSIPNIVGSRIDTIFIYSFRIYPKPVASYQGQPAFTMYSPTEGANGPTMTFEDRCESPDAEWHYEWTVKGEVDKEAMSKSYTIPFEKLQTDKTPEIITCSVKATCKGSKKDYNEGKVYGTAEGVTRITVFKRPSYDNPVPQGPCGDVTYKGRNIKYFVDYSGGDPGRWTFDLEANTVELVNQNNKTFEISFDKVDKVENTITLKATNSLNAEEIDIFGESQIHLDIPIHATVYEAPESGWETEPSTDYFYGTKLNCSVKKMGGFPGNASDANGDGWYETWTLDGEPFDPNNDVIPSSEVNSRAHELKVTVANSYKGEKWYSFSDSKTFTAWKNGTVSDFDVVYDDGLNIYEGTRFQLVAHINGGFTNGWEYRWSRKDDKSSVGNTKEITVTATRLSDNASEEQTYVLDATNRIGARNGVAIPPVEKTITVWRKAEIPTDFSITDKNTGGSAEKGVREGNQINFYASPAHYGYQNNWYYLWNNEGRTEKTKNNTLSSAVAPAISQNDELKSTSNATYRLQLVNLGPNGTPWEEHVIQKNVTVYRKPKTPSNLVRKGDGSSYMMIAFSDLNDSRLQSAEYRFVFGYTDASGVMHRLNETANRYYRFDNSQEYLQQNSYWVYAVWHYTDGAVVTSGLRYLEGEADETFDASDFSTITRGVVDDVECLEENDIIIEGGRVKGLFSGIQDGVITIYGQTGLAVAQKKYQSVRTLCEDLPIQGLPSGLYIVHCQFGNIVVTKKIIVK